MKVSREPRDHALAPSSRTVAFSGCACIPTFMHDVSELKRVEVEIARIEINNALVPKCRDSRTEVARRIRHGKLRTAGRDVAR
jgi:hypothetical protein